MGGNGEIHKVPPQEGRRLQKLTYEELHTLLCQVECFLNSRPLLPLSSHSDDGVQVLTPGHFLVAGHSKLYLTLTTHQPSCRYSNDGLSARCYLSTGEALVSRVPSTASMDCQMEESIEKHSARRRGDHQGRLPSRYPLTNGTSCLHLSGQRRGHSGSDREDMDQSLQASSGQTCPAPPSRRTDRCVNLRWAGQPS